MKKGITIGDLAQRVSKNAKAKRDFVADTECIRMKADGHTLNINGGKVEDMEFQISDICHRQIGGTLGIPAKYYDKLRENSPSLLAQNVNWWLHTEKRQQMIRTLSLQDESPKARAFLSERYRPLDNVDLINELVPLINEKGADVKSCELTEKHLYLHASFPEIEREIKENDVVRSGIVLRNSEVGLSSLKVQPWIERLKCMNGMIVADSGVRKYHVGKNLSTGDLAYELMSDETKIKTDKAFWSQVKDVVSSTIDVAKFENVVNSYAEKAEIEVASPARAVDVTSNLFSLSADEGNTMLQHLCEGGDYTQWGIANSVTRMAHDEESYDRAVELEEIGGQVMELNQRVWAD